MSPKFIAIAAVVLVAAACSRPGTEADAFRWTTALTPGAIVHVRDGAGSITVTSSPTAEAVVTASRSWRRGRARDVQFVVKQDGNEYYICAMWRNSGNCGSSGYKGRSTGGFLSMFSLFHRTTDASANFTVALPSAVHLDVLTSIGSVTIDGANAGVYAKTANGSVTASNVSGSLVLATSNGNVHVSAASLAATDSVHLNTRNGEIRAELPANVDGTFDLRTSNGFVRSAFPIQSGSTSGSTRHLTGQIGSSTRPVYMRTSNGPVIVTTRPAAASQ